MDASAPGSARRELASGVKWSLLSQLGRRATQIATTILLARLLAPADFGLVGMAMAVIVLVDVFKDLGTASALVQRRELPESLLSSVFWIQAGAGLLATLAVLALAPLAALLFQEERVTGLLRWLAWSFVISGLGIAHQTLLTRDLAFARLARLEVGATLAGAAVGLGAALSGAGARSLVYQNLAFWSVSTLLLWLAHPWRPRLRFHLEEVRSVWSYSLHLTGFNLVNYAARNADTLLVGAILGPQALGFYNMAYRIMLAPLENLSRVLARVLFPYLSRIQNDDERFARLYLRWVGGVALVSFPLMLGLLGVAEPLVLTVLGERWSPLVPLLLVLAPAGMLQSVVGTVGSVYKAKAGTARMFRIGVIGSAVAVLCYAVGLRWGVIGVAAGCTVATTLLAYPNFALALDLIGVRVGTLLRVLWLPTLNGLAMLAVMLLVRRALPASGGPEWAALALGIGVGAATYAAACGLLARAAVRDLWASIRASI